MSNNPSTSNNTKTKKNTPMHPTLIKRLQKELMSLQKCPDKTISARLEGENLFNWVATIEGPIDTVYEGLTYELSVEIPLSYPTTPPVVQFITPCYHPNVNVIRGDICLDVLNEKWATHYDIRYALVAIQTLLADPNIEDPLNEEAADLWSEPYEFKFHVLRTFNFE